MVEINPHPSSIMVRVKVHFFIVYIVFYIELMQVFYLFIAEGMETLNILQLHTLGCI